MSRAIVTIWVASLPLTEWLGGLAIIDVVKLTCDLKPTLYD